MAVWVFVQMSDPAGVEGGASPNNTMDLKIKNIFDFGLLKPIADFFKYPHPRGNQAPSTLHSTFKVDW